ncbi:putative ATP-binding cassette transporter [Mollisia scopiformis]|uniref:Putative ATP-binding cassette transporter n=1 Tax=Mollisia scopiformis TaxID=149040 RepID=A0A132B8G1_MOLSC|nr:putative ATP-binding cassette transporter [Mollisia scopiformis]KUJ07957.1 putative ATP-binding cassette transporter [Mollisia scopiformis]
MSSNSSYLSYPVNSFGPTVPGEFDFTLLFEDTILSILPSVLLLAVLPFRLIALRGKPRKVFRSHLSMTNAAKLFLLVFTCMQTALLGLSATTSRLRTRATIVASVLTLIDAIGLCILSHAEHLYSIRPSAIINIYLLLSLPFDIARIRTLWRLGSTNSVAATLTGTIGIKCLILFTEAIEKRTILLDRYRHASPEATSGIYSRSFFFWLNNLMRTGFTRVLSNEDLYPIDDSMTSRFLNHRAHVSWTAADKSRRWALMWATLKATRSPLLYCIFPRLCMIGFQYAQPFLLFRTVNFANNPDEPDSIGWGLTAAFGLVFLGLAISNGAYYHMCYRFVTTVRGSLVSLVYAKTIDLNITALDESVAVTLMSNDTEAICQAFQYVHELWAVPIELGIALWLLNRQLGLAFLAPGAVAILSTTGCLAMAKYMGNAQKIWMEGIQTRVDVTATMLSSMKSVKMLGFTSILSSIIQSLRITELKLSTLFRKLLCVRVFFGNSTNAISPLATFVVFVIIANASGQTLNAASAYTALSLISLLSTPMNNIAMTIPMLNAAMACFERIESFLKSDARRDHRLPLLGAIEPTDESSTPSLNDGIALKPLPKVIQRSDIESALIVVQDASFAWSLTTSPAVRDLSFTLQRGQVSFIIGPVGSGKSTLLKGLLGETPSSQGFVYSASLDISFVDQTSWIRNGTVQQNILGISSYDEGWYSQVVHCCGLENDISILPKGHATQVGSAGISLSGGQKQRLALARAVYAKKELIFLDDVFSGLDAETEDHICSNLFGKDGLFYKNRTTVLFATHAVQRLSYADNIIVLGPTGRVLEQGSFAELKAAGGYVQSLSLKLKAEGSASPKERKLQSTVAAAKSAAVLSAEAEEIEISAEDLNRQSGDFAVYKYYFSSIGWAHSTMFFGWVLLYGIASKMTEFVLTYWTKAVAAHGNEVNGFYLGIYALLSILGLVGLLGGVGELALRLVPRSAEVLHARLLSTVMGAPLTFFTKTDTGQTTNRFSQDMTVLDAELPYSLIDLCFSLVVTIMGAALMCVSAGYFAATMPPIILIVWVLQKYYLRTSRQLRLLDLEAKSPLYSHFIESLSGLVTIRAFGWGEHFQERNLVLLDVSQKPYYLLFCIQRWLALVLDLLVMVMAVILMILVVKLRTEISPGFVGLALLNVMSFNQSLAYIIQNWTKLETSIGAISRLMNFSRQTASENLPGEDEDVTEDWPAFGNIEFKNVSASYTANDTLVVRNLNMSINAGEKIGICGRSGSGKSSLITTLFRMLEVTEDSSITIDGVDITRLPRELVRSRLNAIPQEPFFVRGTVRANADPNGDHTDDSIISAIQKVHLWDLVFSKGGLNTELDSEFFSHGQRQLFCLARAILRRSKVVVLDEATSSVDTKSDDLMQQVIRKEFVGCTVIAVAHRLDTIMDFDRIALLSKGSLVEFDSPQALMARPSAFRELYNS